MVIRRATMEDLGPITEIYNEAVLTTTATFDTTPKNLDEQKLWFVRHSDRYPVVVVESERLDLGHTLLSPPRLLPLMKMEPRMIGPVEVEMSRVSHKRHEDLIDRVLPLR